MPRFVYLADVVSKMADYAPPAWCKLALYGALLTEKIPLYSAKGHFRAYLPPYSLMEEGSKFPSRIRMASSVDRIIDDYGLASHTRPNVEDITIWEDTWDGEAKRIAVGWMLFGDTIDWSDPFIDLEYFEVPRDFDSAFGYDDIHPEGDPDTALTYQLRFEALCVSLDDAETLAPMVRFEGQGFAVSGEMHTGLIGRPRGTGYHSADDPIVQKMLADHDADPTVSVRQLAAKYVGEAAGYGTDDSKIKRLERRYRAVS
jgi:hypothetical protein